MTAKNWMSEDRQKSSKGHYWCVDIWWSAQICRVQGTSVVHLLFCCLWANFSIYPITWTYDSALSIELCASTCWLQTRLDTSLILKAALPLCRFCCRFSASTSGSLLRYIVSVSFGGMSYIGICVPGDNSRNSTSQAKGKVTFRKCQFDRFCTIFKSFLFRSLHRIL